MSEIFTSSKNKPSYPRRTTMSLVPIIILFQQQSLNVSEFDKSDEEETVMEVLMDEPMLTVSNALEPNVHEDLEHFLRIVHDAFQNLESRMETDLEFEIPEVFTLAPSSSRIITANIIKVEPGRFYFIQDDRDIDYEGLED